MITRNYSFSYSDIQLERIKNSDFDELNKAAAFNEIWTNTSIMNTYTLEGFRKWFDKSTEDNNSGKRICFVIKKNNITIGSTSYYDIKENEISIGYTWHIPSAWGSTANPICKYILIKNAFEHGVENIFFHIDIRNLHSQSAIKKLGAEFIKVIPNHKLRPDGTMRDTMTLVIKKVNKESVISKLLKRIHKKSPE